MIAYFTKVKEKDIDIKEVDAIDIIQKDFMISIRMGGFIVKKRKENGEIEEIAKLDLDLT